ncbi:hypothetical protein D9M68_697070 [compost metagenome]
MPRILGVAEVDLDVRRDGKALVISHLLAAIPRQRFVQLLRRFDGVLDQGVDHSLRVFAGDLQQHDEPRLALDQGDDLAVSAAEQQIAFPVARYRAIFDGCRPLTYRNGIADSSALVSLRGVEPRVTHDPAAPQVFKQLLLQRTAGLYIKATIDGLV